MTSLADKVVWQEISMQKCGMKGNLSHRPRIIHLICVRLILSLWRIMHCRLVKGGTELAEALAAKEAAEDAERKRIRASVRATLKSEVKPVIRRGCLHVSLPTKSSGEDQEQQAARTTTPNRVSTSSDS